MNLPAFPAMHYDLAENEHGLTMRDYFAAKAMQGIFASGNLPQSAQDDEVAFAAYKMADAMLNAREA